MVTKDGKTINRTTAADKYAGDPMAEYLDLLCGVQGNANEETGDVESPVGYIARFGRHIIQTVGSDAVWRVRYPDAHVAAFVFASIADRYDAWAEVHHG